MSTVPSGRWRAMPAVWALAALVAVACSTGGRPDVAAVVEGVEIRSSDTEALVDAYLDRQKNPEKQDLPRDDLAKLVLAYQIKIAFVEALADQRGVSSRPESFFDTAAGVLEDETYRAVGLRPEDFARSLRAGRLSEALAEKLFPNVTVSENAVREEYERREPELSRSWKATVQIARFSEREPAGKVKGRVTQGEPFPAAASALGASLTETVDINPVTASLSPRVLDAIGALEVGEVSDAIAAGEGWMSIRTERRDELEKATFDDLRAELTELLVEQERSVLFRNWFDKQFTEAEVKVEEYYGEWNADATAVI